MAFILIDLLLTILAFSNLLAAEISDQKYNQERFNNYIAEVSVVIFSVNIFLLFLFLLIEIHTYVDIILIKYPGR